MSSSTITPLKFTGVSTYSSDFQLILNRAVQIAALPIQQLQNNQSNLLTKKQSLTALSGNVQSLSNAIQALGTLGANRSLSATSTDTTKVTVQVTGTATPASYTISEISSVARRAAETSAAGFATADSTAVDSDNSLELKLGSNTYALDLSSFGNNLNGLRDAINASGAAVTASVLNTGNATDPYYLSITANSPGATSLELRTEAGSAPTNLLTGSNQGADSVFKLNGLPVDKPDTVISDVIPGINFNIRDTTSGGSVVLNLTSNRGDLATGLQNFVDAYNATVSKVNLQVGQNAGLLSGDYIVRQIQQTLSQVTGYRSGGSVQSLAELGIELDKHGVMSFNSTAFYTLPTATIDAAFTHLGSATTGFGALSQKLNQISDPLLGLIRTQQDIYDQSDKRISDQIAAITDRITNMQTSLSEKLQQADALLSSLASQQTLLTGSLQSVTLATFGKQSG